ncbi:MAG: archaeal proteasome endopeptidase complex subunit beta [Candidatus Thermoplasmatota archaeon]|nr:archaeal proteasome endopeptidase complex subunit beta [Candidatus Thermoplasmatota archaeon]
MKPVKTGTTTVGMVCKDGVVLATEHRATLGTLIAHKNTQKLFKIDDHLGLTVAGLVGDAQMLAKYLTAEVELYKMKNNKPISVGGAANLLSNILSGSRYFPYWVQLLIGGADKTGKYVYALDAAGGSIPDVYVSTGSGSPYVYGVMEDYYKENMSADAAIDLAIRAITMAMRRDAASGNGLSVAAITEEKGFVELDPKDIEKRIAKLKL